MVQESLKYILLPGNIVFTRCSDNDDWLSNSVISVSNQLITLNLSESYFRKGLMIDDFIYIRFYYSNQEYLLECQVTDIDMYNNNTLTVVVNNIVTYENRRKHFRYYAKLGATLKSGEEDKGVYSIVTNISVSGLGIISKRDLEINSIVYIDLFASSKNIIPVKVKIVRKKPLGYGFEYGAAIVDIDDQTHNNYVKLIAKIATNLNYNVPIE